MFPLGEELPESRKALGEAKKREGGVRFEARKVRFSLVNDETQSIDDDVLWLVDEALLASNPIREWRFDLQVLLKLFLLAFPVRVLFLKADDDGLRTVMVRETGVLPSSSKKRTELNDPTTDCRVGITSVFPS